MIDETCSVADIPVSVCDRSDGDSAIDGNAGSITVTAKTPHIVLSSFFICNSSL